ncbi:MAG: hypothetical protein COC05_03625 [Gammaproteobacteria bacterium]|nr:MAG: hypothetical protein COC05_03625 [Gammaproteobacteria bacterium]
MTIIKFMRKPALTISATSLLLMYGGLHAAPAFSPPAGEPQFINEPQVIVAPIVLSNNDLRPDGATGYRPWFENSTWQGDLIELDIDPDGVVSSSVDLSTTPPTSTADEGTEPNWSARIQFENTNENFWDTGRNIIVGDGNGGAVPFRFASLSTEQQSAITTSVPASANINGEGIVNFIRGDRSNERPPVGTGELRLRFSVLGDIIHSPPQYVAAPNESFDFDDYAQFVTDNSDRPARVYVGANDGMLHAFDAATGDEVFAYIPSMVVNNLSRLSRFPYEHTYFVDGQLATADVNFANAGAPADWRTVLVGGLGAGGKGFFALDITDAEVPSEGNPSDRLLWEIDNSDSNDIGFSYSKPTITRLSDDNWYAIVGNGYNSSNGAAKLLIIDIATGNIAFNLEAGDRGNATDPNGLSSPSLIDSDNDGLADTAYAGDINGNLWKFDLSDTDNSANWAVAFNGEPLLALGETQPIIAPPDVAEGIASGGFFVYAGTGRAFTPADLNSNTVQSIYGVIDDDISPASPALNALQQTLTEVSFPSTPPQLFRTDTALPINFIGDGEDGEGRNRAWRIDAPAGERFLTEPQTRAGRVQISSYNPNPTSTTEPQNWLTQPAFNNGGAPIMTILDLNGDGVLDNADNDQSHPQGSTSQEAIAMGLMLGDGIRSQATIAVVTDNTDTALINGLFVPDFGACPQRFADICLGVFTETAAFDDRLFQESLELDRRQQAIDAAIADGQDQATLDALLGDLNKLRRDRNQAIDFIGSVRDELARRNGPNFTEISTESVQSNRTLGPNFTLGRRTWVELEP